MAIVADRRSPLVQSVASHFGKKIIHADLQYFADSESIIEIEDAGLELNDKFVLMLHPFSFSSDAFGHGSLNDQLMQVLLLAHQIKAHRTKNIMMVLPYLPYGRQCRNVDGNFIGPLQAVGLFCNVAGVDHVATIEPHEKLCASVFPIPLHEISLSALWEDVLQKTFSKDEQANFCFVSPDRGGVDRVKQVAELFNASWAFVEKKRTGPDKSKALKLVGDVKNKIVIIVDDILDTGQTAVNAADMVIKNDARSVFGCFAHAVMSKGAAEKIEKSCFEKIWVSNSVILDDTLIGKKISVVNVDKLLITFLDSFFQKVEMD